jgi:tetratricopeptide (TPR) repeat protein
MHSQLARWFSAGVCLVLAAWVAMGAVVRPLIADVLDRRARLAEERGDLAIAVQSALDSLQIQPFRLSTQYLLAGLLSRLPTVEAHEMAIEQCLRIQEFAPDYADVTFNLGQLYLAAGQPSDALAHLRRAAEINPYDVWRLLTLASALHDLKQDDEALRQLDRALQLQPDNQAARELLLEIQRVP